MCFSATASFGAGAVLTVIGFATLKKTRKPAQHLFAAIPLLFAVQQFAEGILWVALPQSDYGYLEKISTGVFIIVAHVVWPLWVPLSILQLENNRLARQWLSFFTGLGLLVSLYLGWCFVNYGVTAAIDGYHISYRLLYPDVFKGLGGYFYVLVTLIPPFLSHYRRMWLLGLALLVSYLVTKIYYDNYIISVWCFFAALISSLLYFIVSENKSSMVNLNSNVGMDLPKEILVKTNKT